MTGRSVPGAAASTSVPLVVEISELDICTRSAEVRECLRHKAPLAAVLNAEPRMPHGEECSQAKAVWELNSTASSSTNRSDAMLFQLSKSTETSGSGIRMISRKFCQSCRPRQRQRGLLTVGGRAAHDEGWAQRFHTSKAAVTWFLVCGIY